MRHRQAQGLFGAKAYKVILICFCGSVPILLVIDAWSYRLADSARFDVVGLYAMCGILFCVALVLGSVVLRRLIRRRNELL